jgi:hypothetical protein
LLVLDCRFWNFDFDLIPVSKAEVVTKFHIRSDLNNCFGVVATVLFVCIGA